jgi:prevent-host-death family protein
VAETVFNIHDAKTRLSQLVARAEKGEKIVIARAGRPVAQLVAMRPSRRLSLDDPLIRVEEFAYDGRVEKLTDSEMDKVVYGI